MPKFIDRVGMRYGKLVVCKVAGRNALKKVLWECQCDCGAVAVVTAGQLATGHTISCGCANRDAITKHGGWKQSSYNTWRAMLRRCYNPKDKDYPRYGGRGVIVCTAWHDYVAFAADMGEPIGDETLDRIDAYGNYEPSNCRWAGVKTQNRNIRVRIGTATGITGVAKTLSGKYMAKITCNKRAYYSKCFDTIEEAARARKDLEQRYWGAP